MRTLIIAAALVVITTAQAQAQTDKILHFIAGAGLQSGLSIGLSIAGVPYSPEIGLAGALTAGISKEVADKKFDPADFAATAGGGLISYITDRLIRAYISADIPDIDVDIRKNGAVISLRGEF